MASVKNDWLGYLDRSFQQIKTSLLSRVTVSNPELTDHSDSNIFVIIIEMFAAIAEMIGYYIDNMAEEAFLAVARRKTSIIKHTRALDYRVKARHSEQVDLIITWNIPSPTTFSLSAGLSINTSTGVTFFSVENITVQAGETSTIVPVEQFTTVNQPTFGVTSGTKNQKLNLGTNYLHRSLSITIAGQPYTEVDTFAFSRPTDRHFIVEVSEDGNAYAVLGNGTKGLLELGGLTIALTYKNTLGTQGKVGAGRFDSGSLTLVSSLPLGLLVSNANSVVASSGGTDYEALEDIRDNAVASIRTLDRAVTPNDHESIIEALPGIARAKVHFCCGKTIDIYIVPSGGGIPSTLLINTAQNEINDKKMMTTFPVIRPAGETGLILVASVTARKRKSVAETQTQVVEALVEFGSLGNQQINGAIRLSDLQALIDNLPNVDFVDITAMYTKPYARPRNHTTTLLWLNETKVASINVVNWRIEYVGTNIRIYREAVFQAEIALGATWVATDNIFQLTVQPNGYINGQIWDFTTYPYLKNIQLQDFTVFKINQADLNIDVIPSPINPPVQC